MEDYFIKVATFKIDNAIRKLQTYNRIVNDERIGDIIGYARNITNYFNYKVDEQEYFIKLLVKSIKEIVMSNKLSICSDLVFIIEIVVNDPFFPVAISKLNQIKC